MSCSQPSARPRRVLVRALIVLLVVVVLAAGSSTLTLAQGPARVSLSPCVTYPMVGDVVQVEVRLENVVDLFGAEVAINFDPQVLEVLDADSATEGIQISGQNAFWNWQPTFSCPACNVVNNTTGKITYAISLLGASHGVTGSGTLASIQFRVRGAGLSKLTFDPAGTNLPSGPAQQPAEKLLINGHIGVNTHQLYLPLGSRQY